MKVNLYAHNCGAEFLTCMLLRGDRWSKSQQATSLRKPLQERRTPFWTHRIGRTRCPSPAWAHPTGSTKRLLPSTRWSPPCRLAGWRPGEKGCRIPWVRSCRPSTASSMSLDPPTRARCWFRAVNKSRMSAQRPLINPPKNIHESSQNIQYLRMQQNETHVILTSLASLYSLTAFFEAYWNFVSGPSSGTM